MTAQFGGMLIEYSNEKGLIIVRKIRSNIMLSLIAAIIAVGSLLTVTTACTSSSSDKYHEKEVNDTMNRLYKKGSDGKWYKR